MKIALLTNIAPANDSHSHCWQHQLATLSQCHDITTISPHSNAPSAHLATSHPMRTPWWPNQSNWQHAMRHFWATILPAHPEQTVQIATLRGSIDAAVQSTITCPKVTAWQRPSSARHLLDAFTAHARNVGLPPLSVWDAARLAALVDNAFFFRNAQLASADLLHTDDGISAALATYIYASQHDSPVVFTVTDHATEWLTQPSRPGIAQSQYVATLLHAAIVELTAPSAAAVVANSPTALRYAPASSAHLDQAIPLAAPKIPATVQDWEIFAERYDWIYRMVIPTPSSATTLAITAERQLATIPQQGPADSRCDKGATPMSTDPTKAEQLAQHQTASSPTEADESTQTGAVFPSATPLAEPIALVSDTAGGPTPRIQRGSIPEQSHPMCPTSTLRWAAADDETSTEPAALANDATPPTGAIELGELQLDPLPVKNELTVQWDNDPVELVEPPVEVATSAKTASVAWGDTSTLPEPATPVDAPATAEQPAVVPTASVTLPHRVIDIRCSPKPHKNPPRTALLAPVELRPHSPYVDFPFQPPANPANSSESA